MKQFVLLFALFCFSHSAFNQVQSPGKNISHSDGQNPAIRNIREGMHAFLSEGKWGFEDAAGRQVIAAQYKTVSDFIEGQAVVFKGRWLLVDKTGNIISESNDLQAKRYLQSSLYQKQERVKEIVYPVNRLPVIPEPSVVTNCPANMDFEDGNFTNWFCYTGRVTTNTSGNNSITFFNNNPVQNTPVTGRHKIIPATSPSLNDPYGGFPINPPDGSGYAIRLGNDLVNDSAEKVRYVVQVPATANNYSVTFQYAVVLENPTNNTVHSPEEKPRMIVQVRDAVTNAVIQCADFLYVAAGSIPGFFNSPVDANVKCKSWTPVFVNLSAYAGHTVYVEFTTADCTLGAHFGYGYVDVGPCSQPINLQYQCLPNNIATLSGPTGFQAYNWWNENYTTIVGTSSTLTLNPSPAAGTIFHLELIPFNGSTCMDTIHAVINPSLPAANAGPDRSVCVLTPTTLGSAPVAGYTYQWTPAANLSNAQAANPVFTSSQGGSYLLTVTDAAGCQAYDQVNISVNPDPVADFNPQNSAQCIAQNSFTFQNTSTLSSGTFTSLWNFGDGNTSTSASPSHSYTTPGTYSVSLTVTSNFSCAKTIVKTVTVYTKPVSQFAIPNGTQCLSGNLFTFSNNSTITNGTLSYIWNFGDNTTSGSSVPSHSYNAPGTYTVHLIATSNNGCIDSVTNTVIVNPSPAALASTAAVNQCISQNSFSFQNNTANAAGLTSLWNFGDGNTSGTTNPVHTYATAGNYTVTLNMSTGAGCSSSTSVPVNVFPKPNVSLSVPAATQCFAGNLFNFSNNSNISSGSLTYAWNFGDAVTSAAFAPAHSYAAPGNYIVKLVATSGNGCKDSTTINVTVNPSPVSNFATANGMQCFSQNSFTFQNNTVLTSGTYTSAWNFGDGGTSAVNAPVHVYNAPGNYTVTLVTTTAAGCTNSINHPVTVNASPVVTFAVPASTQCLSGNNFIFNNSSTISSGTLSYAWTFGDGGLSTVAQPTHHYTAAGNYVVQLVVTSNTGCKDSTTTNITVNPSPVADFATTTATQCLSQNSFSFQNNTVFTAGSYNSAWNFGDGATSTLNAPVHIYNAPGNYTVTLVTTTAAGCTNSVNHPVTVNASPVVSFAVPASTQCLSGNNFIFNNSSTISSGTLSYAWSFGDGSISTAAQPSHSYTLPGNYTVQLVVTSNTGCKDSTTQNVIVSPQPQALFNANTASQCLSQNNFTFDNQTVLSQGTYNSLWTFGDGGTSALPTPSHNYLTPGNYTVTLNVTTAAGCTNSITHPVNVFAQPNAAFSIPSATQCLSGNNFSFSNTSTPAASGLVYNWDFGDGSFSSAATPSHSYTSHGNYIVKLVVTNANGCKDSVTSNVVVNPQPQAVFNITQPNQCVNGNNFSFSNSSTLATGQMNYAWTFGDGQTSTQLNPSHIYASANNYNITLTVNSAAGCSDVVSHSIIVNPKPSPAFSVNSPSQCFTGNNFVIISNTSTVAGGPLNYLWDFGDGSVSSVATPSHSYDAIGSYTIKLVAVSSAGCRDSITQTININPNPVITLSVNNDLTLCRGNSVPLSASGAASYHWTPSLNLSCTNCSNPVASPANNITYFVTGTNSFNCATSDSVKIRVMQPFQMNALNDTLCIGDSIRLYASGAQLYNWTPATGLSSTSVATPLAYSPSTITYTVAGRDTANCFTDTAFVKVTVAPKPTLSIGGDITMATGETYQFVPHTTNGPIVSWIWDPGTYLSCITCPNPVALIKKNISYTLNIRNVYGCPASATVKVNTFCDNAQVFIPNAFTPDNDGKNDVFLIRAKGISVINYLRIFNRWGELIFEKTDFQPNDMNYAWNGLIRGVPGPPDVFVYTAEVVCENGTSHLYKGNVSVIK